jgi:hypothetical protein
MLHAKEGMQFDGDNIAVSRLSVLNLTGGALVQFGVYALDFGRENAATTTPLLMRKNLVAVSANNINGIVVVAERAIPANESGLVVVSGPTKANVNGAVVITDRLKAVAGSTSLAALSSGVGSVDIGVAKPMETKGAGVAAIDVLFDGESFNKVVNAAVS